METNVDLLDAGEPVELMFDVTDYKADKQVINDYKAGQIAGK